MEYFETEDYKALATAMDRSFDPSERARLWAAMVALRNADWKPEGTYAPIGGSKWASNRFGSGSDRWCW